MDQKPFDFSKLREIISNLRGPKLWRSFDELLETEEFKDYVAQEYPNGAVNQANPLSRREFLKLMGASLVMAGLAGCQKQPVEKIVPYGQTPENMVPGKPLFFATAMPLAGTVTGLLAESHMGRPTKVEGNPEHPDSLGATNVFHQASVLDLYDPDRSKVVMQSGQISTWDAFLQDLETELEKQKIKEGAGLRLLTETVSSPTLASQIQTLLKRYPLAKWFQYDPLNRDNARKAQQFSFGEFVDPVYDLTKADIILSLDADFLSQNAGGLRYARQFSARRQAHEVKSSMNRFYMLEASPTVTGSNADHRLPLTPSEMILAVTAIAHAVGVDTAMPFPAQHHQNWIQTVSRDLMAHRGAGLVIAGDHQPPIIHALAYAMNEVLGNVGKTVRWIAPAEAAPQIQTDGLKELADEMAQGTVDLLVMLGGNPVYNAPADLGFEQNLQKVSKTIHLSHYEDETSARTHWQLPRTHYLENFSDGRASDGTLTTIQPLIAPLYGGKSHHSILAAMLGESVKSDHDIVRNFWKEKFIPQNFEKVWKKTLHDGFLKDSAAPEKQATPKTQILMKDYETLGGLTTVSDPIEIIFRPDTSLFDGRFANNSWLQELPKPLTKLTWDNAALISPETAEKHGLSNGDLLEIQKGDAKIQIPAWITPGQAAGSVTLSFGYGRNFLGRVGSRIGTNVFPLRTLETLDSASAVIRKTGKKYKLASTQLHHSMENRHLVRTSSLENFLKHPDFAQHMSHEIPGSPSLYPEHNYKSYAWGMAVNLNACIGCNACVIACQSENNIPVVGKQEVAMGREMHWIRIDRYYEGDLENPEIHHQPVMCMHCENAPCEPVCPVGATVHSDEGLNEMVYNRCVGTRYCSNNCPYKVRRFNFYQYTDKEIENLKLLRNPDVTVRSRGVMEKCTFCVQRINHARIEAEKKNETIKDGDVVTACQSACPTRAITFGDINDKHSAVSRAKALPLNYGLLTELNTKPRLTYLAKVTNPHPDLAKEHPHA